MLYLLIYCIYIFLCLFMIYWFFHLLLIVFLWCTGCEFCFASLLRRQKIGVRKWNIRAWFVLRTFWVVQQWMSLILTKISLTIWLRPVPFQRSTLWSCQNLSLRQKWDSCFNINGVCTISDAVWFCSVSYYASDWVYQMHKVQHLHRFKLYF